MINKIKGSCSRLAPLNGCFTVLKELTHGSGRRGGKDKPSIAMSGRQYNMYNSQTAEAWKQRVMKENLHNAPSLRVFADLEEDDDNQSVSSMGSRATGMTRASVATSKASVASTAALNRVRAISLPCRSGPISASPCSLHH